MNNVDAKAFATVFAQCLREFQAMTPDAAPAAIDSREVGAAVTEALRQQQPDSKFPPLESITSEFLDTATAAYHLNRRPQTLRWWHHIGADHIRAVRRNGRLAWRTDDVRKFLRGEVVEK